MQKQKKLSLKAKKKPEIIIEKKQLENPEQQRKSVNRKREKKLKDENSFIKPKTSQMSDAEKLEKLEITPLKTEKISAQKKSIDPHPENPEKSTEFVKNRKRKKK